MSLFPAYAACSSADSKSPEPISRNEDSETKSGGKMDWLTNLSFVPVPENVVKNLWLGSKKQKQKGKELKRKGKDKESGKKRKIIRAEDNYDHNEFIIDKNEIKEPHQAVVRPSIVKEVRKKKKKQKKKLSSERYFTEFDKESVNEESLKLTPLEVEEFFKVIENYNIRLRENPNDIDCWVEYIRHQDKGEGTKKGIAEKKLSILDRALSENPNAEALMNMRFEISEKILPTDKLAAEIQTIALKNPNNTVGWEWLIKCNQFTLSRMTVPNVLSTYSSALQRLHKPSNDPHRFLDTLLQCGLFLRQAGLLEHLWLLLENYMEVNFPAPTPDYFKVSIQLPEKEINDVEDSIVTCGLPLGALWLRLEFLRESVHFLPVDSSEDPQRMVLPEDVSKLVYPVKKVCFGKLIAIILTLLKIPPLPATDSFNDFIGLKSTPWAYESTEYLLAAVHHSGNVQMDTKYINIAKELAVSPQYLIDRLGRCEFFQFVDKVFDLCSGCCEPEDEDSILIWRLRWWKFIATIRGVKGKGKEGKEVVKRFKKLLGEKRGSVSLFTEYALLEKELGNTDVAVRVLETTMSQKETPLHRVSDRISLMHLYRIYVQVLCEGDITTNREKAIKTLLSIALMQTVNSVVVNDENIEKAKAKYKIIIGEMKSELLVDEEVKLCHLLVPNLSVSISACYAWLLYLTDTIWEAAAVMERAISDVETVSRRTLGKCTMENYYEVLVNMVHHFCVNNFGHFNVLGEMIERATKLFPDNLYFSSVAVSTKASKNIVKTLKNPVCSSLGNLLNVFIMREEMLVQESEETGGSKKSGLQNKMYNLLKKLSTFTATEACPLLWRLVLQFVCLEEQTKIRKIFFQAVEKCPWVKCIYYGAAQILPEELGQIQDLLVEKELRLHITPEEIEILRENVKPNAENSEPEIQHSEVQL